MNETSAAQLRTPLHDWHASHNGRMVEFGGWEMPLSYSSGTVAEHLACRAGASMFDVSHLGTVRVSGPDGYDRLQHALTNDLRKIEPGRAQYTQLLDPDDGSVTDDLIVWWRELERFAFPGSAHVGDGPSADAIGIEVCP